MDGGWRGCGCRPRSIGSSATLVGWSCFGVGLPIQVSSRQFELVRIGVPVKDILRLWCVCMGSMFCCPPGGGVCPLLGAQGSFRGGELRGTESGTAQGSAFSLAGLVGCFAVRGVVRGRLLCQLEGAKGWSAIGLASFWQC